MIIDFNKKTVQELRQRCRELLDEGILDATRTEISRARKAELIEWIEFYDDDEDDLEKESGLEHQIIAAKPRSAIESYPTENDFKSDQFIRPNFNPNEDALWGKDLIKFGKN